MAEQHTISIDAHCAHPAFGSEVVGMLLQAMRESPAPMMLTEPDGCILKVNEAFEYATGYAMDELVGRSPSMLRSGLQGRSFYSSLWASLGSQGRWQGEIWNRMFCVSNSNCSFRAAGSTAFTLLSALV